MSVHSRIILSILGCIIAFHTASPTAQGEEGNKYDSWQAPENRLESLITELDQIIGEGTKARAAHPGFLQDINAIIDRYRTPKKIFFFTDDFSDYNFTENPPWTVSQGSFSIDAGGGLYSSVDIKKPPAQKEGGAESDGDRNLRILLGVLNELAKEEKKQPGAGEKIPATAMISSSAVIPNSFNLEYSFKSNSEWGSTSIGVIQGSDPQSGYHLVYQASPAENRPMQLLKYRYGKPYIIDEVRENPPSLDDGADHNVRFSRSQNGDMTVTVDNVEVMRTADLSYRDDFTGVMIINNGGSYSYDNIKFYLEQ